jgi:hypothetical protein
MNRDKFQNMIGTVLLVVALVAAWFFLFYHPIRPDSPRPSAKERSYWSQYQITPRALI